MNVYGLIGYPLGHSFSKKYFTQKFEKEDLRNCSFELFPLPDLATFPELIQMEKELSGLAVTIPYKESIIPHLTLLDEKAIEIGAVNCISICNNILKGYNTDVVGFERSFTPLLKSNHTKALVLGSGGSSKAVQFVLKKLGIRFLVVTRKQTTSEGLINYGKVDEEMIKSYSIIINCTPVGMSPNEDGLPDLPYHYIDRDNLFYDLIYTPEQTNFLKKGLEKGAVIKNGYEMLVIQAEENWRIWNEL